MSTNKYEYRMTLCELTNTLQNRCHDGYADKSVDFLIEQNDKRVYMSSPLLSACVIQEPNSITLVMEDKNDV